MTHKGLDELSPEEIEELNEKHRKQNDKDFEDFKNNIENNICWVCGDSLDSFDELKPCQHWLLLPKGFRKKHFKKLFEIATIDKIEGFLRWYVNAREFAKNINDLKEEHDTTKIKAMTIKHNNLEWSFSISPSCFKGDHGSHGPHYHFQMRVDGRPFQDYSDRHIKLSDYEVWLINIDLGNHPKINRFERHGAGMQDLLDFADPEVLLENMRSTKDDSNAAFNISTMVIADDGETISGDDIADLIEEHNRTGTPMHQLAKKLQKVKTTVFIEPGEGVPEAAQRTQRNRGKKKKP